jgi:hypothetical protein
MRTVIITIALLISVIANCQIKTINFIECKVDQMVLQAEIEPQWNCDTVGMLDFLNKYVVDKNLSKVTDGKIFIEIIIHADGKPCCSSFANLTKVELNPDAYKDAVNKMPNWTPAIQKGQKINFAKNQIFYIKNGKFVKN